MQYPLPERIGNPDLLVSRAYEFDLLDKWLGRIPQRLSKSRLILAQRKSGKTAIVQRIFNRLWDANGAIIPFYFNIPEAKMWYPDFAVNYYRTFASHYISFRERDVDPIRRPLSLEQIREYGVREKIDLFVNDVDMIREFRGTGEHFQLWQTAYSAPDGFAAYYDQRILVIIDEFQNITQYVYREESCESEPDESMAGGFHDVVESKQAPMLVTGS